MPSRDYDPPHDEQRPESRWAGEPPREAGWRDSERRYARGPGFESREGRERGPEAEGPPTTGGSSTFTQQADAPGRGSAFAANPREPRGPAGPGASYGGGGGRASASQAYGYEPPAESGRDARASADSGDFSQSVYDRNQARQRATPADWERRVDAPGTGAQPVGAFRGRGWQRGGEAGTEQRLQARAGWERHDETQFDADYRQWREEQMRMLDREYAQWRQERYRKFAEEFSQWRSQRVQSHSASIQRPEDTSASLGETSALGPGASGTTPMQGEEREHREGERASGGLLSGLLGGHGDRHKPKG